LKCAFEQAEAAEAVAKGGMSTVCGETLVARYRVRDRILVAGRGISGETLVTIGH